MLKQIDSAIESDRSISFETTLSGKIWGGLIKRARARGYRIISVFVSLDTVERSIARIAERKRKGGHDIPESTVRRRWMRCHANFLKLYSPLSDSWYLFDNTSKGAVIVAQKTTTGVQIFNKPIFERVERYAKG